MDLRLGGRLIFDFVRSAGLKRAGNLAGCTGKGLYQSSAVCFMHEMSCGRQVHLVSLRLVVEEQWRGSRGWRYAMGSMCM